jgi:hypothetical protein
MDRPNNPSETKYLLIGEEEFERLLRSYYILGKGLLAFEYLCGHSDRPMCAKCSALRATSWTSTA